MAGRKAGTFDRKEHWGTYFRSIVREWQYADESGDRCFLNFTELARVIGKGITDTPLRSWWERRSFPSKENCHIVAHGLGRPVFEVLEHAGYAADATDGYTSLDEIAAALQIDTTIADTYRRELVVVVDAAKHITERSTIDILDFVIQQPQPILAKAEYILSIINTKRSMQHADDTA